MDVRDVDWGQLHHTVFPRDGVQERIEWVGRPLTYSADGVIQWGGQPCPLDSRTLVTATYANGDKHSGFANSVVWAKVIEFHVADDGVEKPEPAVKASNPKDAIGVRKAGLSCLPMAVVAECGVAMTEGAAKYGRHNFRAVGVRASVYYDAVVGRHLLDWWEGEDTDTDSGLSHITKAIVGLMVLRDSMIQGNWTDDRPPSTPDLAERRKWLNELTGKLLDTHADKSPKHYTIGDTP
jgi:hypothetical protein